MFLLWWWLKRHPEIKVQGFDLFYPAQAIAEVAPSISKDLSPGVYIVSGGRLIHPENGTTVFRRLRPIDRIGYSMFIYELTVYDLKLSDSGPRVKPR
jgi:hypothetical protein